MKKRNVVFIIVLICFCNDTIAQQKQTEHLNQVWLGYLNQTRLSKKWGVWFDAHMRTKEDFVSGISLGMFRTGLTYYIKDNTRVTAGYSFVNFFPGDNHKNISQPEHRPWQQLQWYNTFPRMKMMQWIRLEERFKRKILNDDALADGYSFNFRLRYNILAQFPLSKKAFQPHTFSFVLNDELHINFGKEIVYNYFDQNRFFTGFNYHLNKHDNLQFGYSNVFQQLSSGNKYKSYHVGRIFFFHNLDLRKK